MGANKAALNKGVKRLFELRRKQWMRTDSNLHGRQSRRQIINCSR